MAGIIVNPIPINPNYDLTVDKKPEVDFDKLLDDLNSIEKPKAPTAVLTDDADTKAQVKEILEKMLNKTPEEAAKIIDGLDKTDTDKVLKALKKLLESVDKAVGDQTLTKEVQELVNSVFSKAGQTPEDGATDALAEIQLAIEKLKKDSDLSSNEILAQLIPLLAALGQAQMNSQKDRDEVQTTDGMVNFGEDNSSYLSIPTSTLQKNLNEIIQRAEGTFVGDKTEIVEAIKLKADTLISGLGIKPEDVQVAVDENGNVSLKFPNFENEEAAKLAFGEKYDTLIEGMKKIGTTTDLVISFTPKTEEPVIPPVDVKPIIPPTEGEGTTPTVPPVDGETVPPTTETPSEDTSKDTTTKPEVTPEIEAKKGSITEKTSEINGLIEAMAANRTASPVVDVSADEMKANQVENQVFSTLKSIISNPKAGTTEMQLTLTPDDLGRINIKLVNAGGNISVEIAAQSETTQKLLESKLPSLIAGLQGTNSNVESVKVVEPNQNAQNGSLNLNNFTANGQNSSNQNNRNRTQQTKQHETFYAREILKPASTQEFKGGNKLWQTV